MMSRPLHTIIGLALVCLCYSELSAQTLALDNILVSKRNGVTNIQIWPSCRMRYVDHTPGRAGLELRIRMIPDTECAAKLEQVTSEVYMPMGRRLGNVSDVRFDEPGNGESYITLNFDVPQEFQVRQHAVGWIEIFVDTTVDSNTVPAQVPPPLEDALQPAGPPGAPPAPQQLPPARSAPRSASERRPAPESDSEYVVQLGVFSSVEQALAELGRLGSPHHPYTTAFVLNGETWHGLQVGFFDSELAAEEVLAGLRTSFPDSWVRHVGTAEVSAARMAGPLSAVDVGEARAVQSVGDSDVTEGELIAWMDSGRTAMLERRYDDAIADYTRVLQQPSPRHRGPAREYLGVAFERSGQSERAIAEYRAYLTEDPDANGIERVQARLTGLLAAAAAPPVPQATATARETEGWQFYGGISQYYWRNEQQLVHDGNRLLSSSGVLALGDVTATRRGERFDILARVNGAYQLNLVKFDDRGDIGWVSDAYIDVLDNKLGLQAKVGRQTRRSDGVLGRFDGAALRYYWRPDVSFSVSAGLPLDSPRFVAPTHRYFYAASAQFENLWDRISVNAYTHQQVVDGIDDRRAVGGEVQYRNGALNVVGLLDYDLSYAELNTALVNGTWILDNDWRLNGGVRVGSQPYLTTRNALAGQTARSIDELSESFSEGQIRTLARDRTAQSTTVFAGVRVPIGERLDVSLDVNARRADATAASGGVASIPETGTQLFVNASLIGSSILRPGDLTIVTLRHDSSRTRDAMSLMMDLRLPVGEGLRVNPRLSLMTRRDNLSDTDQLIAAPSIRILYRWRAVLFDLEAGGRWSSRDLPATEFDPFTPDGSEELLGAFVNLGYRLEF